MKRTVFILLLALFALLPSRAQKQDLIRFSCGPAAWRLAPDKILLDAELGYIIPTSRFFGISLSGEAVHYYSKRKADYGHDEEKYQLLSFCVGLNFTPLNRENQQLAINLSLGPAWGTVRDRKILYYDTGPLYVDNSDSPLADSMLENLGIHRTFERVFVPTYALSIDYLAFVTERFGIGASAKLSGLGPASLRLALAWRL